MSQEVQLWGEKCHFTVAVQKRVAANREEAQLLEGCMVKEAGRYLAQRYKFRAVKTFSHRDSQRSLTYEGLLCLCSNKRRLTRKQFA